MEMSRKTKNKSKRRNSIFFIFLLCIALAVFALIAIKSGINVDDSPSDKPEPTTFEKIDESHKIEENQAEQQTMENMPEIAIIDDSDNEISEEETDTDEDKDEDADAIEPVEIFTWDESWVYADYSKLHSDSVTLYRSNENRNNIVIAINAGHGTKGGSSVFTLCHPDGSPKVTGGSTAEGAIEAPANSEGTTFLDGTPESYETLRLALVVKEVLLQAGYDVLMLRESDDAQIDNVARTVYANNLADCHISIHYDSTDCDKGFFYISVPDISSYRNMEPVASHWQEHNALGDALLSGMKSVGAKVFGNGSMAIDLTQTSYSTIPSVDIEVGDRASNRDEDTLQMLSDGIVRGVNVFFSQNSE